MRAGRIAALACAAALVAGCALNSRTVVREIDDASKSVTSPLASVAIVAIDRDAGARRLWEDAFAARFAARGVATTKGEGLLGGASVDTDAVTADGSPVIAAARKAGAEAIVFIRPPNAVPVEPGRSAYRWLDARSGPDPRTDLDTTPVSVTEVRVFDLTSKARTWRAMVLVRFPQGAADAGDDGRFRIGVRAYRVGSAFLEHRNLVAEALPRLERLMESSGETANLAVIENGAAVFVAQVPCRELMRMNARLGARAPLHASGVGKAMLAAMPARDADALVGRGPLARYTERTLVSRPALAEALARSAERGYAIDDEEHAAGLRCVASAIADEAGRPWAAVSLAGPTSRLPQDRLAELGERVRAAARDITAALGGVPVTSRGKEPR